MKINNLYGAGPPKKLEKQSVEEVRQKKIQKKETSETSKSAKSDLVQISAEAKELQKADDELVLSKELLGKLPSARAHVIYEALAKIKAGFYASDEIVEEAAAKLISGGDLDDIR